MFLHRGPLVHLHVTYPTGRTHRPAFVTVVVLAYAAALYDGIVGSPWVTGALALLVAGAAVHLYVRTSGPARKAGGPALAAALAFAVVLALSSANVLLELRSDTALALTYDAVVCAIALGLTADLLFGRWTEATVADLVSQLSPNTDATGLQAALRRTLDDPDLVLGYWADDRAAYVDDEGRPLDLTTVQGQVVTEVQDDGRPAAVLVHSASVSEDIGLLEGAVAVARLSLGNARMRLEADGRAAQLADARRRLVEVADEQRRTLSAELADGADRHLVAVGRHLADIGRVEDPALRDMLATLQEETRQARVEVRELLAGIRPLSLETGGLTVALAELADRTPLSVEVRSDVGRLSPAVEAAVYFVCAEALTNAAKHAAAQRVAIGVTREQDGVVVVVADDGHGGADPAGSGLRGLIDRVNPSAGPSWSRRRRGAGLVSRPAWTGARVRRDEGRGRRRLDDRPRGSGPTARRRRVRRGGDRGQCRRPAPVRRRDHSGRGRRGHSHAADPDRRGNHRRHRDPGAHPGIGVLVLSAHLETHYAMRLIADSPEHIGYLLKDRVADMAVLVDALGRLVDGECVVDPTIVARLMRRRRDTGPLDRLTAREREVLGLMAEGRSNSAIADELVLGAKTVEAHVRQILQKLDLEQSPDDHRRVLAVLQYLQAAG